MADTKVWTPIHEDKELTVKWFAERGFELGTHVFYNSIRDGSGRYDGFGLDVVGGESMFVRTVREAEIALNWYESQKVLATIREAGHNTSDWSVWAQKWCAHGMRPSVFKPPAKDAPEEPQLISTGFPNWRPVAEAPRDGRWFWNLFRITTLGVGVPTAVEFRIQKVHRSFLHPDSLGHWSNESSSIPDHCLSGMFLLVDLKEEE